MDSNKCPRIAAASRYKADVQTTKNLGRLVAGSPQPVQAAVAAE